MRLKFRGWSRNHGWIDVSNRRLKEAEIHTNATPDIPYDGVVLDLTIPTTDEISSRSLEINFRADLRNNPLNGEYMVGIKFTPTDIVLMYDEICRTMTLGAVERLRKNIEQTREEE